MKKKRYLVYHCVCLNGLGGVQTQFQTYWNYIKEKNDEIEHVHIQLCACKSLYDRIRLVINLTKLIRASFSGKSIIHVYNGLTSLKYMLFFSIFRPVNLVHHERGNVWNVGAENLVVKVNSQLSKKIICNSNATKEILSRLHSINTNKLCVIYNGVFQQSSPVCKQTESSDKDIINLLYIGRIEPHKGVDIVMNALQELEDRGYSYVASIVGTGSALEYVRSLSKQLKCPVSIVGYSDRPHDYIKQSDCVLVPSIREPLGNVIIEAGLHCKAVIAANVDGIPEIISHMNNGVLIEPDIPVPNNQIKQSIPVPGYVYSPSKHDIVSPLQVSHLNLANEIIRLIDSPRLRRRLGQKLHLDIQDKFSVEQYASKFDSVYSSII